MKVVEFQMQLQDKRWNAKEILRRIDPRAPIPCALEGGTAGGPLYQCVLDKQKGEAFLSFCKENPTVIPYTSFYEFTLDEDSYDPHCYVHWGYEREPAVSRNRT
jgi:hypothetical protein